MSVLIGADFVPTESNKEYFSEGNISYLFGNELLDILRRADYRIFNLETPLSDIKNPIEKVGPSLVAPTSTVNAYKAINVNLLTLANNHIMDQGVDGLTSTIHTLKNAQINYVGVGRTLEEASKSFIIDINQKKIGIYACAEHEFSIATNDMPGANPYDPFDSLDHISSLRKESDYVIVLYHGGKEYYRYPSPQLQKRCRKMIEMGANLVICQHSHCIGCEEKVHGGTIVYGQGNFLFDHNESESWQTGVLVEITDCLNINYIPIIKKGNRVRLGSASDTEQIMNDFETRSNEILQEGFINTHYSQLANEYLMKYLYALYGKETVLFRVINRLSRGKIREIKLRRKYGKRQFRAIRNFIECEAHHELLLEALKEKS